MSFNQGPIGMSEHLKQNELADMWLQAKESDEVLQEATHIVIEQCPHFPTSLEL